MKEVKIFINGELDVMEYCSQSLITEEESFYDQYYVTCGWSKIDSIYVNPDDPYSDDNENVTKQKGKYVKTKEYFHDLFSEDGYHPLPVEVHERDFSDITLCYIIELEDDEEFDIKQLQLIKSDYECLNIPYFILAEKILYKGKEVEVDDEDGEYSSFGIDGRWCNEYVIDSFCP